MKKTYLLYSSVVFIFLVIFFVFIHPIAIFDTDDWSFIHHLRLPIPVIGAWNPIKVFPEITMSFFSYVGAYILYPLTGRYCYSLSVSNGLFICFMITVYFLEFFMLINRKYSLSTVKGIMISIVFICCHFILVTHPGTGNVFLFYAYDMTCVYHYTLSTIVNAALVMHMIRLGGYQNISDLSVRHKLLIAVWTYLAIFSSLYTNIILAVYIGVELLTALISNVRCHEFSLSTYCRRYRLLLLILLIWFSSLAIELTGGRSSGRESDFLQSFFEALTNIWGWFSQSNPLFLIISALTVIAWIALVKSKKASIISYLLSLALTTLYLILLSSVVDSSYVSRIDVIFAADFWLLLILMFLMIEVLSVIKKEQIILTALAVIGVIGTIYSMGTYKEMNYLNISYAQCEALADDIISQFKVADEEGLEVIDLIVPKFDHELNWPMGLPQAEHFTKVMYRHRITRNRIVVREMIPSEDKTHEFIDP